MAKKAKKYEAEATLVDHAMASMNEGVNMQAAEQATDVVEEAKKVVGVAKPMIYLEAEDGVQYQFTRFPMPKRAEKNPEGEFTVLVDQIDTPAWTTASRGWAADDKVIEYIWIELADHDHAMHAESVGAHVGNVISEVVVHAVDH